MAEAKVVTLTHEDEIRITDAAGRTLPFSASVIVDANAVLARCMAEHADLRIEAVVRRRHEILSTGYRATLGGMWEETVSEVCGSPWGALCDLARKLPASALDRHRR